MKVKFGDVIDITMVDGKSVVDTGVIVEVFEHSFQYYSCRSKSIESLWADKPQFDIYYIKGVN